MRQFPKKPKLLLRDFRKKQYELIQDHVYQWNDDGTDYRLIVREGFICDLASVPRIFWSLVSDRDLGMSPPLYHDALYRSGGDTATSEFVDHDVWQPDNSWGTEKGSWSRKQADELFNRQMTDIGISYWKRRSAYWAVRSFGFNAWDKDEYL